MALFNSFASRISFRIIATTTVILLSLAAVAQFFVRSSIIKMEEDRAQGVLSNTELKINTVMDAVATVLRNNIWAVEQNLDSPQELYFVVRNVVESNKGLIVGSALAFEPYYYKSEGIRFSPYCYNDGKDIFVKQLGSEEYDYHSMDWYLIPKLLDKPYWSEPYYDEGGGEQLMTTYSMPLKDKNGKFFAIFTADVSLSWLSEVMDEAKYYEKSYNFILGRGGTFITHPQRHLIYNETFFTLSETLGDPNIAQVGYHLLDGKSDREETNDIIYGPSYIFYKPIERTGWSMAIICSQEEIFSEANVISLVVAILILISLIVLAIVSFTGVKIMVKPMKQLASSADEIAHGNLQAPLPAFKSHDEMGRLLESFRFMQSSLHEQMDELGRVNAQKGRIEGELKVASDIQMSMLPKIFPPFPDRKDIDIYGTLHPAKEIGGDLFDFFIREDYLFFCIGDVSGKGVPAALVMSVTRTLFRNVANKEKAPDKIISQMNNALAGQNDSNMFVTLFVGILDLQSGRMKYCNAGHDSPILVGESVGLLPVLSNVAAGVIPDFDFVAQEVLIDPFTTIFLYTDGLTEAENANYELFGLERLKDTAVLSLNEGYRRPKDFVRTMTSAVHDFVGEASQSDDITMLAIQYKRQAGNVKYQRSITIINDMAMVPKLNDFIAEICSKAAVDKDVTLKIQLAIEESVVNVIDYAYPKGQTGNINVEVQVCDSEIIFSLRDNGVAFDPTTKEDADTTLSVEDRPIGGLGIYLVRQIMDSVRYERNDGANILTLTKYLP